MSRVSEAERRKARLQDRDRARLVLLGIDAATRIGFRAQSAALRAWRGRGDPVRAARRALDEARPLVTDAMLAGHLAGMNRSAAMVRESTPLGLADKTPYDAALRALQRRLDLSPDELDRLREQYDAAALSVLKDAETVVERRLQETIAEATAEGVHVREGVQRLAEAFEKAGLTPNNSFTLEAIFRTQTAVAYSAGRHALAQDPAIQEILWGYKYVTVGDDRVRPEHVGFDGVTLPKDDPFWNENTPPNGYCCRCVLIEVFDQPAAAVEPPEEVDVDGVLVRPRADEGFRYNPGMVFGQLGQPALAASAGGA